LINRKKIFSGIAVDYIASIVAVVIGFIVVPYYFDYITKAEFGVWLLVSGIVAFFSMADLGADQYLTTVTSNDDKFYSDSYSDYVSFILVIKIVISIIISAIAITSYIFLTSIVDIDIAYQEAAKITFILSTSLLIFGIFFSTVATILYARHHYSLVNLFSNFFAITASVGTVFLLHIGYGIVSFPLALLVSTIIQYSILFIYLSKKYKNIKLRVKNFTFIDKKEIVSYSTNFQVLKWVHTLRTQYVVIAINNLIGPIYLTQYNLTNRLPQLVPQYASKIILPFFPTISDLFHKKDLDEIKKIFINITKVLFRVSIFSGAMVFTMNESFISLWVGNDKFAGNWVVFWIVLYMMGNTALGIFGVIIFSSKKFERWISWSIFEIVLAVLLSYMLHIFYGFPGIVAGIVLASLLNQYYLFHIVLKQLGMKKIDFLKNIGIYSIVPNVLPIIAIFFIYINYNIDSWLKFLSIGLLMIILSLSSWEFIRYVTKRSML
jgi:O-antigen/teichoic acid export membrane protein